MLANASPGAVEPILLLLDLDDLDGVQVASLAQRFRASRLRKGSGQATQVSCLKRDLRT